ncbi:MAG: AAA family ATPase [Deltaproteobacteria bacterium]|nr:AAA family ATPase [Deltaproteobacteria bacterium]
MYYEHFGLSENPFRPTPDPRYLYLSRGHREALNHLIYGITERKGFILITGDVGTGKTTLLRALLAELDSSTKTALLLNPFLSEEDLLPAIAEEFGISAHGNNRKAQLSAINEFLLSTYAQGGNAVLLLDEAQNLSRDLLEQVRILSNLETETDKLLQIVLVGQPELSAILAMDGMKQLSDRVVVRFHLGPLDEEDTKAYVQHRLMRAGCRAKPPFARNAWAVLYDRTGGVPRRINAVCDRALLAAYGQNRGRVTAKDVKRAAREVAGTVPEKAARGWPAWKAALASGAFAAAAAAGAMFLFTQNPAPPSPSSQAPVEARAHGPSQVRGFILPAKPDPQPQAAARQPLAAEPFSARPAAPDMTPDTGPPEPEPPSALARLFSLYRSMENAGDPEPVIFSFYTDPQRAARFTRPFRVSLACGEPGGCAKVLTPTADGFTADTGEHYSPSSLVSLWNGEVVWLVPRRLSNRRWGPGSRGPEVYWIQNTLYNAGYPLLPDGIYGPETVSAVAALQKDFGLAADGRVGRLTAGLLYQLSTSEPPRTQDGEDRS